MYYCVYWSLKGGTNMAQVVEKVITTEAPQQVTQTTKMVGTIGDEPPQKAYQKKKVIFRTYQIVWYIVGFIEILLAFRILLKALGASTASGFTRLVYALSDPFALPFAGIFRTTVTEGSVFEWSTFIAGLVYLLLGYGIVQLMQLVKPTDPVEVETTVDNQ